MDYLVRQEFSRKSNLELYLCSAKNETHPERIFLKKFFPSTPLAFIVIKNVTSVQDGATHNHNSNYKQENKIKKMSDFLENRKGRFLQ